MRKQINLQQISKLFGISVDVARILLCRLEKYRVPKSKPIAYYYTLDFLTELKNIFLERSNAIKYHTSYVKYKTNVLKINRMIKYHSR